MAKLADFTDSEFFCLTINTLDVLSSKLVINKAASFLRSRSRITLRISTAGKTVPYYDSQNALPLEGPKSLSNGSWSPPVSAKAKKRTYRHAAEDALLFDTKADYIAVN